MADTTVKYLDSTQVGAPVLNGVAGSLIALLDACLVNGFGLGTPDSVVVAGGVCTVTRAAGHPMQVGTVALLAGCVTTGAGSLNGEQKVAAVTTTTYSFATTVANQSATGTITHKTAPAGWTKLFTGTNLAVYQSSDITSTKMCLRVDDTATTTAHVTMYESMTDVNTGVNVSPTTAQVAQGFLNWDKSSLANANANEWMFVGDGKAFYNGRSYRSFAFPTDVVKAVQLHMFGDFIATKAADPYGCVISGETATQAGTSISTTSSMGYHAPGAATGFYTPRAYTGLGTSNPTGRAAPSYSGGANNTMSGQNTGGMPFPNPTDGGLYLTQEFIFDAASGTSNNVFRGYSPGLYVTPQVLPVGAFNTRDIISGVAGLTGKTLRATVPSGATVGGALVVFDTTGPWR